MDLSSRIDSLTILLERSGDWMAWNTFLAWIPVALALPLFRFWQPRSAPVSRSLLWWFGLTLFVLFLPNAPYLLTDLVHVRADVQRLAPDGPVATTVLPLYGLLVLSGFVAYYLALAQLGSYLDRVGLGSRRPALMLGLHGIVAVGVFLGRWSRLNSWEPVVRPTDALDRVLTAFTWSAAPVLIATLFVVTAVGHFMTKAVIETAWGSLRSAVVRDHVA